MANRRLAPIRAFREPSRSFKKSWRRLPKHIKRELEAAIDELLAGNLSSGRRCEKLDMGDNLYSVRLNQGYRFVFMLSPNLGIAFPIAVGPHDEAYQRALRSVHRR